MQISIQKMSPLSVREQIKRQIQMLIDNGELELGQALPSARDLSAILHVNRNTITQAYKELSLEGYLEVRGGSGTYVRNDLTLKPKKALDLVFNQAVDKAKQNGYALSEILEHFLSRISSFTADLTKKKILVVDCNDEVINYLCHLISTALGVQTQGVLISEIEKDRVAASTWFEGKDLVVCGLNHLEELRRAAPDLNVEVMAVLLHVDVKAINYLSQLPKGTKIGCVCANQRSTETLYNSAYFSGGKELRRILAGFDNSKKLQKLIRECDVIFASNFVYDRMKKLVTNRQKIINVKISVDPSNIELIREKLFH